MLFSLWLLPAVLAHNSQRPLLVLDDVHQDGNNTRPRIAVIGAGAGGSSFSYYAQRYTSHAYDITIFEQNNYVGGRSVTVGRHSTAFDEDVSDEVLESEVELGGSIFIKNNRILYNAVREFGLETEDRGVSGKYNKVFNGTIGVWNGTDFVIELQGGWVGGIKTLGKILWRYGVSGWRANRELKTVVSKFLEGFYERDFPFKLENVVGDSGLDGYTSVYADALLVNHTLSDRLGYELIQPLTLVNYRSTLDEIHSLGMFISMAAEDAMSVKGGNYQIFEKWIESSNATLNLNTKVQSLVKSSEGWQVTFNGTTELYDQVVIATPWSFADILGVELDLLPVEYRSLYVTYLETSVDHLVDHPRFGPNVPESLLTTGKAAPFFSCNIVGYDEPKQLVRYKVFSGERVTEALLSTYLFADAANVTIWYEKQWHPYPVLDPADRFDQLRRDNGLWYLNGMERVTSTMETAALAGAAVAGHVSAHRNTTCLAVP